MKKLTKNSENLPELIDNLENAAKDLKIQMETIEKFIKNLKIGR